jgi:hypothetical protein
VSINATSQNNTLVKRVETKDNVIVKRVIIGKPVRRIRQASDVTIDTIQGIDATGAVEGSILIYNSSREVFEASLQLEEQNVNGGQY